MDFWEEFDLMPKVENVLRVQAPSRQYAHFGKPFLTAAQLAEKFSEEYPDITEAIVSADESGKDTIACLANYLVKELFGRISIGRITSIEGAMLSTSSMTKLDFLINDEVVKSQIAKDSLDLFIFRYR